MYIKTAEIFRKSLDIFKIKITDTDTAVSQWHGTAIKWLYFKVNKLSNPKMHFEMKNKIGRKKCDL